MASLPPLDLAGTYHNAGCGTRVCLACTPHLPLVRVSCQWTTSALLTIIFYQTQRIFLSLGIRHGAHTRVLPTQTITSIRYLVERSYPEGYGENFFLALIPTGLATFVVENVAIVGFGIIGINGVERTGPVEETFESWLVK